MDRIDRLVVKLDAITRFNEGELPLVNPRMAITTTLNSIVRLLLDEWTVPMSEDQIERDIPAILMRFNETPKPETVATKECLEWCLENGFEPILPVLVMQSLIQHRKLRLSAEHQSKKDWKEFYDRYSAILNKFGEYVVAA